MNNTDIHTYSLRKRLLISIFIVIHFACVVIWISPIKKFSKKFELPFSIRKVSKDGKESTKKITPYNIVKFYLYKLGQWQSWNMFSPGPLRTIRFLTVTLRFEDGSKKIHRFPRISDFGYFRSRLYFRFRKYQNQIGGKGYKRYRKDLVRYIARQYNTNPSNPPVRGLLYRHSYSLPKHNRKELKDGQTIDYTQLLRHDIEFKKKILLNLKFKPGDL